MRKYYFLYVLEECTRCNNMYWVFVMGKVLYRVTGSSILSLRCMLTQTSKKALPTELSDGSGVSKEIEKELQYTRSIVTGQLGSSGSHSAREGIKAPSIPMTSSTRPQASRTFSYRWHDRLNRLDPNCSF